MECWASILGNCAGGQSREHYISDGIFDSEEITAYGLEWCTRSPVRIGLASAVSRILCGRHNQSLSKFDDEASKLSRFIYRGVLDEPLVEATTNLQGNLLEKWALKTFINLGFIGALDPIDHARMQPTAELVKYVFEQPIPSNGIGLYFVSGAISNHGLKVGLSWNAIRNVTAGGTIVGMTFALSSLRFVLSAEPGSAADRLAKIGTVNGVDYSNAQIVYRPRHIGLSSKSAGQKNVLVQWQ